MIFASLNSSLCTLYSAVQFHPEAGAWGGRTPPTGANGGTTEGSLGATMAKQMDDPTGHWDITLRTTWETTLRTTCINMFGTTYGSLTQIYGSYIAQLCPRLKLHKDFTTTGPNS